MSEKTKPIQPLISKEMMERIVSSRRSITSEEALEAAREAGQPPRLSVESRAASKALPASEAAREPSEAAGQPRGSPGTLPGTPK